MSHRAILSLPMALVFAAAAPTASGASVGGLNLDVLRQNYPPESLARGEQGPVEWAVDLDADARIDSCVVTRSSGYPRLDAATCDFIVEHVRFAPAVTADGTAVATTRTGRIVWNLPAAYRQNAAAAPRPLMVSKEELEAQRLFCKRAPAPGSHTKLQTYCLTREEWELAQSYARRQAEEWMSVPTSE